MYRGDMSPPSCPLCELVEDDAWVDPSFELSCRAFDFSYTYDGVAIVSRRFKDAIESAQLSDGVRFVELVGEPGFFALVVDRQVSFDSERRQTRLSDQCERCGRWRSVAGAHPVFLREPVPRGLSRTDLSFGTGREQHPVLLADVASADVLAGLDLNGLELQPVAE